MCLGQLEVQPTLRSQWATNLDGHIVSIVLVLSKPHLREASLSQQLYQLVLSNERVLTPVCKAAKPKGISFPMLS
jgi:hypothetical protein